MGKELAHKIMLKSEKSGNKGTCPHPWPVKKKKEAKPKTVEDDKKTWQVKNWVQYLLKLGKAKKKKRTITKSKLNMD